MPAHRQCIRIRMASHKKAYHAEESGMDEDMRAERSSCGVIAWQSRSVTVHY